MIYVTAVHPSNPSGLPPVLLVHGAANSASVWKYWQESLARLGWSSHAVDLRGHGCSPGSVGGASMTDYADDVAEAASRLPESPVVMGWSMGGLAALMFATRGLARACVALAPSTPANEPDSGVEIRTGTFGPEEYGITGDDPADQPSMPDLDTEERLVALGSGSLESRTARDERRASVVIHSLPARCWWSRGARTAAGHGRPMTAWPCRRSTWSRWGHPTGAWY